MGWNFLSVHLGLVLPPELPAEPHTHTNPPPHRLLWHAELLLNQCTVSGAEKHIQFTTLISLTQSISRPVSHPARHPVIRAAGLPFFGTFSDGCLGVSEH